ncbi:MAG: NAD(P)/FAD-dependent oxidoreductase [Candidatus Dormiibacterota bacterium]
MSFDLAVIGAGSAGLAAATFAARMGASVALIEVDRPGGDCTWTGCVPSKALIHSASIVHQARTSGFLQGSGAIDFDAVRRHIENARQAVFRFETPAALAAAGIEVIVGRARFRDRRTLEVGGRRIAARRVVICTGASPVTPSMLGWAGTGYLTHETVFDLDELPRRLLVVGGGPIGAELAQAFARLGSGVTLVDAAPRLLPLADADASTVLERRFRREGIELRLGVGLDRVESDPATGVIASSAGRRLEADRLLLAVGRRPRAGDLGLEAIGVRAGPGGIDVDGGQRTSVRGIYAAGDVTGGPQFTNHAVWQGFAAARNALFPGTTPGRRRSVPWTIFTDPEIAQVGLAGAEAQRAAHVVVHRWPMQRTDRAQTDGSTDGFVKLLVTGRRQRILGATIVATRASEVANAVAVAIEAGSGLPDLARTLAVYPTYGYAVTQLAGDVRLAAARRSRSVRWLRRRWGRSGIDQ